MYRVLLVGLLALAIVLTPSPEEAHSRSSGASAGVSGAPGDRTCAESGCHGDFELNSGTGSVNIEVPVDLGYAPGVPFDFFVSVDNTTAGDPDPVQGFLITARDPAGEPSGSFEVVDPTVTKLAAGGGERYVTHTTAGIAESSWQVRWIAPDPAPETVTFYAAGNAANGNGWFDGDYIYTASAVVSQRGLDTDDGRPEALTLDAVWPNPTRGTATLSFALTVPTEVTVALLDGTGRQVALAHRGTLGAGPQTVNLSASGLAAGVYFAAVTTPAGRRVLPLTVTR